MKEESLVELAQSVVVDDTVIAAGVFEPKGAVGLNILTGDKFAFAGSFTNSMTVSGLPEWTLLAVSDARIYVIAVRSVVPEVTFDQPQLVGWFDRDKTKIALHMRKFWPSELVLEDETNGRTYSLMSSASVHSSMHADFVYRLLQDHAEQVG